MKRITEGAAVGALERNEWRCALVVPDLGRCARTTPSIHGDSQTPLHHITYRSHGGGHETENLVPLCAHHHDEIHERGKPICADGKGRRFYQLWVGEDLKRHYLWEDVAEGMRDRATELDASFQGHYRKEALARIEMARDLAEMDRFCLFSLTNGEPENAFEYCWEKGIRSASNVRNFLATGSFLLDSPDDYKRLMGYNEVCEPGKEFTYTMLRDSVGTLRRIQDPVTRSAKITEMMASRMAGEPGQICVEAIKDPSLAGHEFDVSAKLESTGATLTLRLTARDSAHAREVFRRTTGLSGALSGVLTATFTRTREVSS